MTKAQISSLARSAYDIVYDALPPNVRYQELERVESVIADAVKAEREACALIAEKEQEDTSDWTTSPRRIAEMIRARGEKP